jgi:hypothetical protein
VAPRTKPRTGSTCLVIASYRGGVLSHHVVLPKKTAPLPSQRGRPQSRPLYSANGEAVDIFADIDSQGTHVENQLCES